MAVKWAESKLSFYTKCAYMHARKPNSCEDMKWCCTRISPECSKCSRNTTEYYILLQFHWPGNRSLQIASCPKSRTYKQHAKFGCIRSSITAVDFANVTACKMLWWQKIKSSNKSGPFGWTCSPTNIVSTYKNFRLFSSNHWSNVLKKYIFLFLFLLFS